MSRPADTPPDEPRAGAGTIGTGRGIILALRFLVEIAVLVALAFWGFAAGDGPLAKVGLGLGAPLLAATIWGMFVAPRAVRPVAAPVRLGIEMVIYAAAALALAAAGYPAVAIALALCAVILAALNAA